MKSLRLKRALLSVMLITGGMEVQAALNTASIIVITISDGNDNTPVKINY